MSIKLNFKIPTNRLRSLIFFFVTRTTIVSKTIAFAFMLCYVKMSENTN